MRLRARLDRCELHRAAESITAKPWPSSEPESAFAALASAFSAAPSSFSSAVSAYPIAAAKHSVQHRRIVDAGWLRLQLCALLKRQRDKREPLPRRGVALRSGQRHILLQPHGLWMGQRFPLHSVELLVKLAAAL